MKKVFILLPLISFALGSSAQTAKGGLYGKTHFIELTTCGSFNILNKIFSVPTTSAGHYFNYGYHFTAGMALNRNVSLGLQAGNWYTEINGLEQVLFRDGYNGDYTGYIYLKNNRLEVKTFSIMPVLMIGAGKDIAPVGVSHEFGIGFLQSKVRDKDYDLEPSDPYSYYYGPNGYTSVSSRYLLDSLGQAYGGLINYKQGYKGVQLMYGLKFRTPVSKSLMLHYGLRYTLNLISQKYDTYYYNYSNVDWKSYQENYLGSRIRRTQLLNFIQVQFGVTYTF